MTEDGEKALITLAQGDMRKVSFKILNTTFEVLVYQNMPTMKKNQNILSFHQVLNILQSCAMAFDVVNEDNVYTCVGHPLKSDITNMVNWMLNESFSLAYKNILELKTLKGLSLQDIITETHLFVHRLDLPQSIRIHLIVKLAEIEQRLLGGDSEKIQLGALIASFQIARDMVKKEATSQ